MPLYVLYSTLAYMSPQALSLLLVESIIPDGSVLSLPLPLMSTNEARHHFSRIFCSGYLSVPFRSRTRGWDRAHRLLSLRSPTDCDYGRMTHPLTNATPFRRPPPNPSSLPLSLYLSGSPPSHGLSFPAATQFGCSTRVPTDQSTCRTNSTCGH